MGLFKWIGHIRSFWWYVSEGQFGLLEEVLMKKDTESPDLFVGKLIGNAHLEGEVISFDEDNIQIKITKLNDQYYERYLDLGKIYPLFRHTHWNGNLLLWEVKPESMKRTVSQILLQWEKDIGWTWDLDS